MLSFWVSVEVSLQKNWSSNSSTVSHYSFNNKFYCFNVKYLNLLDGPFDPINNFIQTNKNFRDIWSFI